MRKELFAIGFSMIVIVGFFSGCQESEIETVSFKGVTLVSDIVELANASLNYRYGQYNEVDKVTVQYLFHNIAERDITVKVTIELYDENDNLITIMGPARISLPDDYTEHGFSPGINIMSYDGNSAHMVDHAIIIAVEEIE